MSDKQRKIAWIDGISEDEAEGAVKRSILDIAQVTAYYAYVNRIADGSGVSLEGY